LYWIRVYWVRVSLTSNLPVKNDEKM
jgi:hypothetical protein